MTALELKQQILTEGYFSNQGLLRKRVFFKLRNRNTGEDLVQTTFLKAWDYIMRGGQINKMKAFLFHILDNLIVDEYRRVKVSSLDSLVEQGFEPFENTTDRMIDISDGKTAQALIAELPEKYRDIIHMRYIENLSLNEISKKTKQSKNTISVQIHRGQEKLRMLYTRGA